MTQVVDNENCGDQHRPDDLQTNRREWLGHFFLRAAGRRSLTRDSRRRLKEGEQAPTQIRLGRFNRKPAAHAPSEADGSGSSPRRGPPTSRGGSVSGCAPLRRLRAERQGARRHCRASGKGRSQCRDRQRRLAALSAHRARGNPTRSKQRDMAHPLPRVALPQAPPLTARLPKGRRPATARAQNGSPR